MDAVSCRQGEKVQIKGQNASRENSLNGALQLVRQVDRPPTTCDCFSISTFYFIPIAAKFLILKII